MDILVTGATGNVGAEVLRALSDSGHGLFAGLRNPATAALPEGVTPCEVDLAAGTGPCRGFDAIFLMRPPQIADPAPFRRFLDQHARTTHIVFLSVQGADTRSYLPHAKIEAVIGAMGFAHTFVRPAYFMENLTTTLAPELQRSGRIYLPAGRLQLDWVSVRDIADVAARALTGETRRPAITIASGRGIGFASTLDIVNAAAGTAFRYEPAPLLAYVRHARKQGIDFGMIAVMLLLHTLPRLTRQRIVPGDAEAVLGRPLEPLEGWARRHTPALRALAGLDG